MALELVGRLISTVVGVQSDAGNGRVVGPRRHPLNVICQYLFMYLMTDAATDTANQRD